METWAKIPSLPGYEASDAGRVRSVARTIVDKLGRTINRPSVVLKPHAEKNGYLTISTIYGTRAVHRCVLEAFVGPRPDGCQCAHWDGNKTNNALTNLRWATPKENAADRSRHGRTYRQQGELHRAAILTEEQVVEIKRRLARGERQSAIARYFAINYGTLHSIARGQSWTHVNAGDL